jgi:hypothetical protein
MKRTKCEYCGRLNEDERTGCLSCGAPLAESVLPGFLVLSGVSAEQWEEAKRRRTGFPTLYGDVMILTSNTPPCSIEVVQ